MLWHDVAGPESEPGPFLATVNVTRVITSSDYLYWIDGVRKVLPLKVKIEYFHAKVNRDSTAKRTRIPRQSERRFHGKKNTVSTPLRTGI
jgi:hypothetical protein